MLVVFEPGCYRLVGGCDGAPGRLRPLPLGCSCCSSGCSSASRLPPAEEGATRPVLDAGGHSTCTYFNRSPDRLEEVTGAQLLNKRVVRGDVAAGTDEVAVWDSFNSTIDDRPGA